MYVKLIAAGPKNALTQLQRQAVNIQQHNKTDQRLTLLQPNVNAYFVLKTMPWNNQ